MDFDYLGKILCFTGLGALAFRITRKRKNKDREIIRELPQVVNALGTKLKRFNSSTDLDGYRTLKDVYNHLAESQEDRTLPAQFHWDVANRLMDEYNLWEKN